MKKLTEKEQAAATKIAATKERKEFVKKERDLLDKEFQRFGFTPTAYTEGEKPHAPAPHQIGWVHSGEKFISEIVIDMKRCTIRFEQHQLIEGVWKQTPAGFMSPLTELIMSATHLWYISKATQHLNEYLDEELLKEAIIPGTSGAPS